MNPKRVESLTDPAVDEVYELLARAYLTNPIHIAIFGGSGEKELQMGRDIWKILTELTLKGEWYAVSDASQIVGVYHMMRHPLS